MVHKEKRKSPRRKVHIPIMCWEESTGRRSGEGKEIVSKDLSGEGIAFYSRRSDRAYDENPKKHY